MMKKFSQSYKLEETISWYTMLGAVFEIIDVTDSTVVVAQCIPHSNDNPRLPFL